MSLEIVIDRRKIINLSGRFEILSAYGFPVQFLGLER